MSRFHPLLTLTGPDIISSAGYGASRLRLDFVSFAQRCFHELNPRTQFAMNRHIEIIAATLRAGEIRRLIIKMPSRYLKSLLASVSGGRPTNGSTIPSTAGSTTSRRVHRDDHAPPAREPTLGRDLGDDLVGHVLAQELRNRAPSWSTQNASGWRCSMQEVWQPSAQSSGR
jgi:hypothetical protein